MSDPSRRAFLSDQRPFNRKTQPLSAVGRLGIGPNRLCGSLATGTINSTQCDNALTPVNDLIGIPATFSPNGYSSLLLPCRHEQDVRPRIL